MSVELVNTDRAPLPRGHYSQAVIASGLVFVSGQLPFTAGPEAKLPEGIAAQARQALENVKQIVEAAGSSLDRLVSVQIFIPDVALWGEVNAVYQEVMADHRPARTVVPTRDLHYGALIEISAVAAIERSPCC